MVLTPVQRTVRWGATHGVLRAAIRKRARDGNLDARMLMDPVLQADPVPHYELIREDHPFAPGAFSRVTVHHDVVTEVLRSDDFGVADRDASMPRPVRLALGLVGAAPYPGPIDPPSMLAVDPPQHTRYRRLISRAFTVREVEARHERTAEITDGLLDEMARLDDVDLVARFASLLPVMVVSEVLGVPPAMRDQFVVWGDGAAASLDMGLAFRRYVEVERNLAALHTWMRDHLRRLRRTPGDDLLSRLLEATDENGDELTEHELVTTAVLVLAAGFETTVNLLANGASLLMDHPDEIARLRTDPSLWPNAIDEILRYDPPVQRTARRAKRDTEVAGEVVPGAGLVVAVLAGANRDPRVFPDPHRFDVGRSNADKHVAFSGGLHYCVGAALARQEGEVALRALFERFPDIHRAGPGRRRPTRMLQGWAALPVHLGSP